MSKASNSSQSQFRQQPFQSTNPKSNLNGRNQTQAQATNPNQKPDPNGRHSLFVAWSSESELVEFPEVPPSCLPTAEPSFSAPAIPFLGATQMYNRELFFISVKFQNRWSWALADTGSSRNLMSERFFKSLHTRFNIRSSNGVQILAGNNACIPLIGFGKFFLSINGQSLCHDFGVVESLPMDVVISGEIMRQHKANLRYNASGLNSME